MKTYRELCEELNEKVRIRFKGSDGTEDELSAKDYLNLKTDNLGVPTAFGGALIGNAVAGPVGALIGGVGGYVVGDKIHGKKFPNSGGTKIQWGKTIKANLNPQKHGLYKPGHFEESWED